MIPVNFFCFATLGTILEMVEIQIPKPTNKCEMEAKIEIIKYAMEQDGFDEIVYMDWDCFPTKPLPENFWETLRKKNVFLACLQVYKQRLSEWRIEDIDKRKVPNGGWVYIGDKTIPSEFAACWEEVGQPRNDEIAYSKWIDKKMGEWKGNEYFWNNFETPFCELHRMSAFDKNLFKKPNLCFRHVFR